MVLYHHIIIIIITSTSLSLPHEAPSGSPLGACGDEGGAAGGCFAKMKLQSSKSVKSKKLSSKNLTTSLTSLDSQNPNPGTPSTSSVTTSRAPDNYFFLGSKCTLSFKREGVTYSLIANPGSKCTPQLNNQRV